MTLYLLHVLRAPSLVNDQVLCRAILCRYVRGRGSQFHYLHAQDQA